MHIRVPVTIYNPKLIPYSISLIPENAEDIPLKKFNWPRLPGRRKPEGGCDDAIQIETVALSWVDNKLIFPVSEQALPIAERKFASEFLYRGSFISQLDGDVAYIPKDKNTDFLVIVPDFTGEEEAHKKDFIKYRAIKVPKGSGIYIEAFVPHSTPIPLNQEGEFEFDVYKRGTNAVETYEPPMPLFIHLLSVDRSNPVVIKKSIPKDEDHEPKLKKSFADESVVLHNADPVAFAEYGVLIEDFETHVEQIQLEPWPWGDRSLHIPSVGALEQDFLLRWEATDDSGTCQEIVFHGLSGSFTGNEGRPGVEFNAETGEYRVNLLMTRPDGSFYVHPKNKGNNFAMVFANPDPETGEPIKSTLKGFVFRHGQAARLPSGVWHTVPIPLVSTQDSAEYCEIIAETNANVVINLQFECNRGLVFSDPML